MSESTILQAAIEYLNRFHCPVIPIDPGTKKPMISSWKPYQTQLPTEEQIRNWWSSWPHAMIGLITGKLSNLFVLDVDGPEGDKKLLELEPILPITPTALTPGGGQHYYFLYPDVNLTIKAALSKHLDYRGEGGYVVAPPSMNSKGLKYAWKDHTSLGELHPAILPNTILEYINSTSIRDRIGGMGGREGGKIDSYPRMFTKGRRDEDLFHVANILIKAKTPEQEAIQVLEKLALSCDPPFPIHEIKAKIKSAIDRASRAEFNVTQMIKEWINVTHGNFSVTECKKFLQEVTGVTTRNLGNIRVPFARLVEEGIIERVQNRDGWFRKVENIVETIDVSGPEGQPLLLQWPFRIERYYACQPGNVVVIAGDYDSGKTAFCLNFAAMNMRRYKVSYMSSEMGASELKSRLKYFEVPMSDWVSYVNFVSRSSNFVDVVSPDEITIIDFLELSDEFWRVGGMIKEIHDKLRNGMCLIAIQKKEGSKIGRGGEFALEKPRLYVSMGRNNEGENEIRIVKCKNWIDPDKNPNGLMLKFKLVRGCKFIETSTWKKGDEFEYENPRD